MRCLLAATCLTPVALGFSVTPLHAETVVSTAVTTPLLTGSNMDDLRISSTGSVKPASGGAAVTINSNHSVKNEGTIAVSDSNGGAGIVANPNLSGNITNTGSITIDEAFTPTDSDNDGDLDGPFAQGSNRFGIHVLGGGTFTGNIAVGGGTILVEGNQSAGIAVDSALTGSINQSTGTISVLGNNSFGLKTGAVSGNVSLNNGTIKVQGANSVGIALDGNIGGSVSIQGAVTATGYRSITSPADPSKLDADDLLQGGPAVRIAGNVAGGIVFDAPPPDTNTSDNDEDHDGILDNQEGTANITAYGAAPAVVIGSTGADTVVGASAASPDGHGLVVKGTVAGFGVYKGVSATGLAIGGLGHNIGIANGMTVGGTLGASAVEADATALRIGSGAFVPEVKVTGSVAAQGGGTDTTRAQAILIETGAAVATIRNSGNIQATRNGTAGTAAAIVDKSGSVTLIENSGSIGIANAASLGDKAIALDLGANLAGVTVRQIAVSGKPAPSISGSLLFGSGSDTLDVSAGTVTGAAKFGLGNNQLKLSGAATMTGPVSFGGGGDSVQLSGTAVLAGDVDFGGGSDMLTLAGTSAFHGALANSGGLAVNAGAGTVFDATNTGTVNLAALTTGAGATIGVTLDQGTNAVTFYNVAGTADFGAGTKIDLKLLSLGGVAGTYKIVQAGTLTGAGNLTATSASLPFLYATNLITSTPGQVSLEVRLKNAAELGLNTSEASILGAVIAAADSDAPVAGVFLDTQDSATLKASLQQMLPEHAGGAFENVTKGSRLVGEILADPRSPVLERGGWGLWAQQVGWGTSKSIGATSSYDLTGWGASAGIERGLGGAGSVGLSLAYLTGKDSKHDNELLSNVYEGGLYWRASFGKLHAFARGTVAHVTFNGTRVFSGEAGGETVTRTADGKWNGRLYSASGGLTYEIRTGRFTVRPIALLEYYRLKEKGYSESGGGDAFDLTVDGRTSDEAAASASLAVGYDFLGREPDADWFRIELEGGRRQVLSGSLGDTVARFEGGQSFTLTPEQRTDGWRGGIRLAGGGTGLAVAGEVNAEEQQGNASIGARLGLQLAF